MPKKMKWNSQREYKEHKKGTPWGQADDLVHWVAMMYEWAEQVTKDIHRIKQCGDVKKCFEGDPDLKKAVNPDDPPQPPWGFV